MTCPLNADDRYRAKLLLVRHAKSSWAEPALADIDRPLKKRGVSDALLMRSKHLGLFSRPDIAVLSSTATRAVTTATILFEQSPQQEQKLYTFDNRQLHQVIARHLTANSINNLAVVGHNPALHLFIENACQSPLEKFPTAAIAVIGITDSHSLTGDLIYYAKPSDWR